MKNLIIRNSIGRVVDYLEGEEEKIEYYRKFLPEGYDIETTNDRYTKKYGKWWNIGSEGENK